MLSTWEKWWSRIEEKRAKKFFLLIIGKNEYFFRDKLRVFLREKKNNANVWYCNKFYRIILVLCQQSQGRYTWMVKWNQQKYAKKSSDAEWCSLSFNGALCPSLPTSSMILGKFAIWFHWLASILSLSF